MNYYQLDHKENENVLSSTYINLNEVLSFDVIKQESLNHLVITMKNLHTYEFKQLNEDTIKNFIDTINNHSPHSSHDLSINNMVRVRHN